MAKRGVEALLQWVVWWVRGEGKGGPGLGFAAPRGPHFPLLCLPIPPSSQGAPLLGLSL